MKDTILLAALLAGLLYAATVLADEPGKPQNSNSPSGLVKDKPGCKPPKGEGKLPLKDGKKPPKPEKPAGGKPPRPVKR